MSSPFGSAKTSSPYPILNDRPIDQWKVTELKDELKRRKLTYRGLKEDLIKRLDEAIRLENEAAEVEKAESGDENAESGTPEKEVVEKAVNGDNDGQETPVTITGEVAGVTSDKNPTPDESTPVTDYKTPTPDEATLDVTEKTPVAAETGVFATDTGGDLQNGDNDSAKADDTGIEAHDGVVSSETSTVVVEKEVVQETTVETVTVVTESVVTETVVTEVALGGQDLQKSDTQEKNANQLENEGLGPPSTDVHSTLAPDNQVSEVNPILGSQVKSECISTDSVSINEKNDLKDNIIADDVKLEQNVFKSEMVDPLSSDVDQVGGESHPMDVEESLQKNTSIEERDANYAANAELSKKIESADVGYSEKLNLDRSSGDDSMEEDILDSKQIDSKYISDEVRNKNEKSEDSVMEEILVDVVGDDFSADKKNLQDDSKTRQMAAAEKRKLHDQEAVGNNDPVKRQRRWNSESIKVPEAHASGVIPTTTPKENLQPTAVKLNFSRSDSSASGDTPKERVVPPSQRAPTNSLKIERFLRPFTLKAVQELLGKTGTVTSFWMDNIKTHCYVTFSSVEEALETRNAVYNLQWPPNRGRLLAAEFVEPQEVKDRTEVPQAQTPTTPAAPSSQPLLQPQPSPRQRGQKQQLPPPAALPPPPPLSNPPPVRERIVLPPPPPPPEKQEPPILTLDDLFMKTKATPRIYYLPLSEEEVAAKLAARSKNNKK